MSIEDLQKSESVIEQPDLILNTYDQAILLIRKGRLNEALSALNSFVQINNDSDNTPLAYFWMGEINLTKLQYISRFISDALEDSASKI
jgi:TolA-binding protein